MCVAALWGVMRCEADGERLSGGACRDLNANPKLMASFISMLRSSVFGMVALGGALGAPGAMAATPFELGVEAFEAGNYAVAKARFSEARDAAPDNVLNQLWLGLATHATGSLFDGADEWRTATGDARFEPMAEFFRGLTYWKAGYRNDAQLYFNETMLNIRDGSAVDYPPAKTALADLAAGKAVPAFATWPKLAGLPTKANTPAPAAPTTPTTPPIPAPLPPAQPAVGQMPAPTTPPVPVQPAVPVAQPARRVADYTRWEPAGTHAVGAHVLFRVANAEWRPGTILEVGTQGTFRDKYLVRDERTGSTNYYYYTDVAGLERRDFWTGFFIGTWDLGSGMAVNERTHGTERRDEYLYVASSERLEVKADGSYVWTTAEGKRIRGRWQAQPANPGIVILKGDRDRDYTFYTITDAESVGVMKEHHARLATPGVMTTLARRRIP